MAWFVTEPSPLDAGELAGLSDGDAARGERMFWASGCASCHAREGATGDDMLELAGGLELETDFGTFVAPNISMHPTDGIGEWSAEDFANAMLRGVSPQGQHYYPAFPYASYARMETADIADLFAFMQTLPAIEGRAGDHDLAFPYRIRRGVGVWKALYLSDEPVLELPGADEDVLSGQYLVEGPGHCGECHTPRDFMGGPDRDSWLAGAPSLEGPGSIPNITPSSEGIGSWSEFEIAAYLESGFTPDFDSAGGRMAAVIRNLARLPEEDRQAIAAYLKAIPAHP
ncbi:MAG: cytochrome c [Mesorhizobium sp.]|nr:cytochrome c [Mesorhizobium sp.]